MNIVETELGEILLDLTAEDYVRLAEACDYASETAGEFAREDLVLLFNSWYCLFTALASLTLLPRHVHPRERGEFGIKAPIDSLIKELDTAGHRRWERRNQVGRPTNQQNDEGEAA